MAIKVYKYELRITDEQMIQMPKKIRPVSVGCQDGKLVMWCIVDLADRMISHTFHIVGTGNPMPEVDTAYIGTVQMPDGLVWHVFKGTK